MGRTRTDQLRCVLWWPEDRPPSGSMAVDCNADELGVQSECTYSVGSSFNIQIHVTLPPPGGYYAFQAKMGWNDAQLDYLAEPESHDEALWPYCDIAASANLATEAETTGSGNSALRWSSECRAGGSP